MAKDTEKLIRQLSLISFLMAERRPITALEIKQEVEGYSGMNDDAFARRFYADRAELESLGIELKVDKPAEGYYEAENYSLPPENFYLPAIEFTDSELGALRTALTLLDGEFAYAEPLRLALQQLSWGKPSPLNAPEQRSVALAVTAAAGGRELSQRLSKIETAIFRRKTIVFDYYTLGRDAQEPRKVDPYHLLFRGGQFYLVGHSHERDDVRVFRLSRIRGKVGYSSKAEHDFPPPEDFDPRGYATRTDWQLGDTRGTAEIWVSDRIAWHVERNFGPYGEMADDGDGRVHFRTPYSIPRLVISGALGYGEHARIVGPPELAAEARDRLDAIVERHRGEPFTSVAEGRPPGAEDPEEAEPPTRSRQEAAIRPERFARLVTLASVLIAAGRAGRRLPVKEACEQLQISEQELREDISVLNVVNFGGGAYVLYAEVQGKEIEVDTEPYSDTFDRPARLLPIEANALIAAIEFLGAHLSEHLVTAREKIESALGEIGGEGLLVARADADNSVVARDVSRAIEARKLIELEYYAPNEDRFSTRTVEPYALINGREGWYVATYDPAKEDTRHFRLDRVKSVAVLDAPYEPRAGLDPIADVEGWPRTGEVSDSRVAQVWISPEQARWAREERTVLAELPDGAVIIEWGFKGEDYLVKEVLKEAGDAAVLEPADAREAVLHAAERLLAPTS